MTTPELAGLRALFVRAGLDFVEPAVLQPVEPFVDLAGEDLRRQLFVTMADDGRALCLRPDYTIPVCLLHLAAADPRPARYAYVGPVFRQRADGPGEFRQAGAEWLGHEDVGAADADCFALAFEAARVLGLAAPSVAIGDEALFSAVLAAVDLPPAWQHRLAALFGDTPRFAAALARLDGSAAGEAGGAGAAVDPALARSFVADLMAVAGLTAVGGRSAGEIAERLAEQAALAAGARVAPEAARVLRAYLALEGPATEAPDALASFARAEGIALSAPIEAFAHRLALTAARGVRLDGIGFSAAFGRRLDYYTGFVFEMLDPARPGGPAVGGGRYDRLVARLGAAVPVPAVGFSIWLERFGAAS